MSHYSRRMRRAQGPTLYPSRISRHLLLSKASYALWRSINITYRTSFTIAANFKTWALALVLSEYLTSVALLKKSMAIPHQLYSWPFPWMTTPRLLRSTPHWLLEVFYSVAEARAGSPLAVKSRGISRALWRRFHLWLVIRKYLWFWLFTIIISKYITTNPVTMFTFMWVCPLQGPHTTYSKDQESLLIWQSDPNLLLNTEQELAFTNTSLI